MRTYEVNRLIVKLLSSSRDSDIPSHCLSLTSRQICNHIEALIPPYQESEGARGLWDKVVEQLAHLEGEFEVTSRGDCRKSYRMAPPVLIIEREAPLCARFVGDRAYFNVVVELLDAEFDTENWRLGTLKTIEEARDILEMRGIAVQTEEMLFQYLPEPALPTDIDLSMAEQLSKYDIGANVEVYVPRRMDFFANRWVDLNNALPSAMSQLRRVKSRQRLQGKYEEIYFWETTDCIYRLTKDQAVLTSYRIDLDRNKPRLLDLDKAFPAQITKELPSAYRAVLNRYTELVLNAQAAGAGETKRQRLLQVRYKYRDLFSGLIEGKRGVNKPLT